MIVNNVRKLIGIFAKYASDDDDDYYDDNRFLEKGEPSLYTAVSRIINDELEEIQEKIDKYEVELVFETPDRPLSEIHENLQSWRVSTRKGYLERTLSSLKKRKAKLEQQRYNLEETEGRKQRGKVASRKQLADRFLKLAEGSRSR